MSKQLRAISGAVAALMILAASAGQVQATITTSVTFNSTTGFAGITAWPNPGTPSAPLVDTTALATNPGAFIIVTEGQWGNDIIGFSMSQSFTATSNGKLTRIQLPITGNAPKTFNLNVYDALTVDLTDITFYDPDADMLPNSYVPGTDISADLLTDQTPQTWTQYTFMGANAAVLDFSLSGADQINIVSGKTYVVELEFTENPNAVAETSWYYGRNIGGATNYEGGQAFVGRRPLNGAIRDIAMAMTVAAPTTLAADFDGLNGVTGADLQIWRSNYGTGTTKAQGDANGDNTVDGDDLLVWQRELGMTGAVTAAAPVPEPAAAALACIGLASLAFARRRR